MNKWINVCIYDLMGEATQMFEEEERMDNA